MHRSSGVRVSDIGSTVLMHILHRHKIGNKKKGGKEVWIFLPNAMVLVLVSAQREVSWRKREQYTLTKRTGSIARNENVLTGCHQDVLGRLGRLSKKKKPAMILCHVWWLRAELWINVIRKIELIFVCSYTCVYCSEVTDAVAWTVLLLCNYIDWCKSYRETNNSVAYSALISFM